MIQLRKKIIFSSLALIIVAGALWFFVGSANIAHALDTGLNYATGTGLASVDPRVTVAKIIRIILGFLGVIGVGLIMYAGFIWMTANGEEEKIEKAKKIMISAAVGLAIVLASFGIASYIIGRLSDATGGGSSGGVCSPACSEGQYCCNSACQPIGTACNPIGGGTDSFLVKGTTPAHQAVNVIRNAVIRFRFNNRAKEASVNNNSFTVKTGGTAIDGQRVVNGNYIEFTPSAACEAPHETLKCFPKNTAISVEAKNGASGIISINNKELICGGTSRCILDFTTGEIIDTEKPQVNVTSQQVCKDTLNSVKASSLDDYGVSKIDFFLNTNTDPFDSVANNTNPFVGSPFNAEVFWDSTGYQGTDVTFKATVYDLDDNYTSAEKKLKLAAKHCCNGSQDEDETGKDCGGKDCLACVGQACAVDIGQPGQCSDNLCQSGFCKAEGSNKTSCEEAGYPAGTTSCCLCNSRPVIEWVSPAGGFCSNNVNEPCHKDTEAQDCGANATCNLGTANGTTNNFVTIAGSGFGTARGKVFFSNGPNELIEAKLANDPQDGNPDCDTSVWKDNQIIALVPSGFLTSGKITVENATSGARDATNDGYGPLIPDFVKNSIIRPGVCGVSPTKGKINDAVEYNGIKLNAVKAYYGNLSNNIEAQNSVFIESKKGTAAVPNITAGGTTTFVKTASNVESNFLPFTKENEPYEGPVINSIDPLTGPIGQYVTIRGSGFGASRSTSKVFFGPSASGIEADYAFPDICAESIWSDKQIVVKVPSNVVTNSNYKITIKRVGFNDADSGSKTFSISAGSPNPGICSLQPILGQPNSEVILWGEYFGAQGNNGAVRFYNNLNQIGGAIASWDIDQSASGIKPWKVVTTVPQAAKTGPVRIVSDSNQLSNIFNFTVGKCTKDSDCGSGAGATCCADGLPEAGKCKSSPSLCYGSVNRSVYQWRFSTGNSNQCAPDQNQCGTVCCKGACDPADPTHKCAKCRTNQNECGDGKCCNQACTGNDPSHCPDPPDCSGYSTNQCSDNYYCPNSGGVCSPYPGNGQPIEMGDCSDNVCLKKPGCTDKFGANICHYDSTLNLCVLNNSGICGKKPMLDGASPRAVIKLNNEPVEGRCDVFSNSLRWHINWNGTSCPTGWSSANQGHTICVDDSSINGACNKCKDPLTCRLSGNEGVCVSDDTICKEGSTCNAVDHKCKKLDTGRCDCCCRKDHVKEDCCLITIDPEKHLDCEGDCGASQNGNLGMCTGCVVNGVADDSLCNCAGTTGKFCDTTNNPRGVCTSCSNIASAADCSTHEACCVDGKNNNKCSGIFEGGERFEEIEGGLSYCAYYKCTNVYPNNSCNPQKRKTGDYTSFQTCQQSCPTAPIPCGGINNQNCSDQTCPQNMHCQVKDCTCQPDGNGAGANCSGPNNACTESCIGYRCLLPSGYNGGGMGAPGETCRCCCNPNANPDSCKALNPNLSCLANKEPCTSQTRGLCCGCSRDDQCGNDLISTGCSTVDGCCRTRPSVESRLPAVNTTNVCRNTVIEATFNQKMDLSSFSGNVWLIGKFNGECPSGTIVASAPRSEGFLASIMSSVKKAVVKLFPSLINKPAFADNNICYATGVSVIGYNTGINKSKVSLRLSAMLEANTDYYVVLQGDPGLSASQDNNAYYNSKISSVYKIGMVGSPKAPATNTFNSTTFANSEIWSFKTGNEVCLLDKVAITPSFQLFQRPGQEAILEATALDHRNNPIQAINNIYSWDWEWRSDNKDIADVNRNIEERFKAIAKSGNKKDAQTLGRAKATVTVDTHNNPSTTGQFREGVAQLRVFLCENPWPVYYSENPPANYHWPWQDDSQKIELYYCRDKAGVGTIDDLPAITNPPVIPPGSSNRKICMFGTKNVLKPCVDDTTCGDVANSCLSEVFKEFFFFREKEPGIPNISGTPDPVGEKVNLTWPKTLNANRYKVYYGLNSGQYILTADVPAGSEENVTKTIDGLVNGLTYYFAVTALSDKNQESIFSNELALKPADITPPAIPSLMVSGGRAANGNPVINLFWKKVPDANSYMAYIGLNANNYALSTPVQNDPQPNKPNHTFTSAGGGLNNETTYHVTVKSIDQYGNTSAPALDIAKRPNEPYLISLSETGVVIKNKVTVTWLPFTGALGYNIYYGTTPNPTGNKTFVGSNIFSKTIGPLSIGDYYFVVKAITQTNPEQETAVSNERSVTVTGGNIGQ